MSRRLVRTVLVPLLAAIVLLTVPLLVVIVRAERAQLVELAERRAATVALLAQADAVGEGLEVHVASPASITGERIAMVDAQGRRAADTGTGDLQIPAEISRRASGGEIAGVFDAAEGRVAAAAPIIRQGRVDSLVVVILPGDIVAERTSALLGVVGAVAGGLVLVAAYAARQLARSVVHPVETVAAVAARLAAGDLEARAPTGQGPPEVRRLAATLNTTAARLQELMTAQQEFVADASHQLRTPLTGLKLRVETMQMAGAQPETLDAMASELDRLAVTVEQLLALAKAEGVTVPLAPVDLQAVVKARASAWEETFERAGVRLRTDIAGPLPAARAVPGALEQILDNYLSNALRVAPAGSTVEVQAALEQNGVVCRVADRGPGLGDDERERAFDRFWRAPSTARDGGSGLGLAIVARLAEASGATVALRPRPEGGLIAEVRAATPRAPTETDGIPTIP